MSDTRPELTVIAGPTASGKTALAVKLAEETGAEIVSADSQQVYRYFNIGTAKPSPEELARVPHHLISVVEPTETFSAAHFAEMADPVISAIASRGKRVLVVGGTGLYIRILLHGVVPTPGADPELREKLGKRAEAEGVPALYRDLQAVDAQTAEKLAPTDRTRIIRALEIHTLTGRPASAWRAEHQFQADRYPYRLFVLEPPREALFATIDRRTRELFDAGLIEETEELIQKGFRDSAPMQSVGYKQALAVHEGRMDREAAIVSTAQETRRYAKRQWTWFRKERGAQFVKPPYAEIS